MTTAVIEVYERFGIRTIRQPAGTPLEKVLNMAHDIWEDHGELIRVRVLQKKEDEGPMSCICHFPPSGEIVA